MWGWGGREFKVEEKNVESGTGMAKWYETLLSLLSDPSWTAGAFSVRFDYFTDNFVPCSIFFFFGFCCCVLRFFSPHVLVGLFKTIILFVCFIYST